MSFIGLSFLWGRQEDLIYVPLFNPYNGEFKGRENAIVVFDMNGMLAPEALEAVTADRVLQIFPTSLSFLIREYSQTLFEVEGCVFLKNQGEDGDLNLYFNTNGTTVEKFEGIWSTGYTRGSVELDFIVDENSVIYTVDYDYNVEGVPENEWLQELPTVNYSMLRHTTHIVGIPTNLRINCFVRSGYQFDGWQLYRGSDEKWLYADGNWYAEQEAPVGVQKELVGDAAEVDNLTTVNSDVITAYAQWKQDVK